MEEQGTVLTRYMVIPRTLIFIFCRDEVLLLKGAADKKIWAGKFNGIGGHVEQGEDLLSSAKRELLEETGITDISLEFCGQIQVDTGAIPGIAVHLFKGEFVPTKLQNSQEGTLDWIHIKEIDQHPLVEDLYTILPAVFFWRPGNPMIFGLTNYHSGEMIVTLLDSSLR